MLLCCEHTSSCVDIEVGHVTAVSATVTSSDEEYYATTYSDPGRRTKFLVDPMKCDYVKQVALHCRGRS